MSSESTDNFSRLAVNDLIVNPNICDGGAIEIVGVRSAPTYACSQQSKQCQVKMPL